MENYKIAFEAINSPELDIIKYNPKLEEKTPPIILKNSGKVNTKIFGANAIVIGFKKVLQQKTIEAIHSNIPRKGLGIKEPVYELLKFYEELYLVISELAKCNITYKFQFFKDTGSELLKGIQLLIPQSCFNSLPKRLLISDVQRAAFLIMLSDAKLGKNISYRKYTTICREYNVDIQDSRIREVYDKLLEKESQYIKDHNLNIIE